MKNVLLFILFTVTVQFVGTAQCDSIVVTSIDIPANDSLNMKVFVHNYSIAHPIYLNLILKDELTDQIIAESTGGYLQIQPQQLNTYNIDTTTIFGQWQIYYFRDDIPDVSHISVQFDYFDCGVLSWDTGLKISENNLHDSMVVYPNPATDIINVNKKDNTEFTIVNTLGQSVINSICTFNKIDISGLKAGVYFLQFKNDVRSYRIIKQ